MDFNNFLSISLDQAIKYDFFKEGDEPDRCSLAKEIYSEIFPWYSDEYFGGDTLNTYRSAIKRYYGNYYRFLDRDKQIEILEIIKKYTRQDEEQVFEFKNSNKQGSIYFQVCNNYQLGNFGIFPTRDGINPKRAQEPYFDFFDEFLVVLYQFYENDDFNPNDELKKAIVNQKDYFFKFDNFNDFIDKNVLWDFFYQNENNGYSLKDLSGSKDFEEYVKNVTSIIYARGEKIWRILQDKQVSNENEPEKRTSSVDETHQKVFNLTNYYKSKNTLLDDYTAEKLAKYHLVEEYLINREEIIEYYNKKKKQTKIDLRSTFVEKFTWITWKHWVVILILGTIFFSWLTNRLWDYWKIKDGVEFVTRLQEIKWENRISIIRKFFIGSYLLSIISLFYYRKIIVKNRKEKIEEDISSTISSLMSDMNDTLNNYDEKNSLIIDFYQEIPQKYRNIAYISELKEIVATGIAGTFQGMDGAFSILETRLHRERLENIERGRLETERNRLETERKRYDLEEQHKFQSELQNNIRQNH